MIDHVTLSRGRVAVFKDSAAADVREPLKLDDGAIVSPDGKITLPGSSPRRLLDGELFPLAGGKQPARDSVTLQGGNVIVQKDGARLEVESRPQHHHERR
ncbi:MAG: hypothetical protein EXS33_01585 [Pedosphaera sp.]|nr:hypothetical protein [Pedosphaera sp.]